MNFISIFLINTFLIVANAPPVLNFRDLSKETGGKEVRYAFRDQQQLIVDCGNFHAGTAEIKFTPQEVLGFDVNGLILSKSLVPNMTFLYEKTDTNNVSCRFVGPIGNDPRYAGYFNDSGTTFQVAYKYKYDGSLLKCSLHKEFNTTVYSMKYGHGIGSNKVACLQKGKPDKKTCIFDFINDYNTTTVQCAYLKLKLVRQKSTKTNDTTAPIGKDSTSEERKCKTFVNAQPKNAPIIFIINPTFNTDFNTKN